MTITIKAARLAGIREPPPDFRRHGAASVPLLLADLHDGSRNRPCTLDPHVVYPLVVAATRVAFPSLDLGHQNAINAAGRARCLAYRSNPAGDDPQAWREAHRLARSALLMLCKDAAFTGDIEARQVPHPAHTPARLHVQAFASTATRGYVSFVAQGRLHVHRAAPPDADKAFPSWSFIHGVNGRISDLMLLKEPSGPATGRRRRRFALTALFDPDSGEPVSDALSVRLAAPAMWLLIEQAMYQARGRLTADQEAQAAPYMRVKQLLKQAASAGPDLQRRRAQLMQQAAARAPQALFALFDEQRPCHGQASLLQQHGGDAEVCTVQTFMPDDPAPDNGDDHGLGMIH